MKQLLKNAKMITAFILAISLVGCSEDDGETTTLPVAGFTFNVNQTTGAVTFVNTSEDATSYSWDFGDETSSEDFEPIKIFSPGTYKVVLTATNDDGSDTAEGDVTIEDNTPDCTAETAESLSAADLNLTFQTDPLEALAIVNDGAGYSRIANPDAENEVNSSCFVAQVTRSGDSMFGNNQFTLDAKLDFKSNGGFTIKAWSAGTASTVTIKLEDKEAAEVNTEQTLPLTKSGEWEELTFQFEGADNIYDKIVLFFDLNTSNAATYYFDDLTLYEGDGSGPACTAETTESLNAADLNLTFQTDPLDALAIASDGAGYSRIANPDSENDLNTSCFVAQVTRSGDAQFANNQFTLDAKLNFNTNGGFTIKTWSAAAGTNVTVKLEDKANAGTNTEQTIAMSKVSEWEELTFTFENADDKFDKIVLFFDVGTNISATYYFDDLAIYQGDGSGGGEVTAPTAAPDAPSQAAADVISIYSDTYTDVANGGFANYGAAAFAEVDLSGNSVLQYTQVAVDGGNFQVIELTGDNQIDATTAGMTNFRFDAWFSNPIGTGASFIMKVVDIGGATTEATITITTASSPALAQGEWLSFDFPLSDLASLGLANTSNIQQVVVDVVNVTEVYLDNIYFYDSGDTGGGGGGGSTSGELASNGDFEDGTTGWDLFQNGGTAEIDNTLNNGGTSSGRLVIASPGNPAFKQERIGAGTVQAGDVVQVKFDLIGSVVQPGAVFNLLLFGEGSAGASFTHVFNPAPALTDSWTTFTGTYTIPAGTDVSEGISFLIEAVCGGDAGCSVTANIDNVSVILNP